MFGPSPWRFFFGSLLPQLASGEVMRFLDDPRSQIAVSAAPFSLPFKLSALGLAAGGWDAARAVNKGLVLLLLALTALTARRSASDRDDLLRWTALASLGSVATRFAGPHVQVSALFLLLLLAGEVRSWTGRALFGAAAGLLVLSPLPAPTPAPLALGVAQTLVLVGMQAWVVLRGSDRGALSPQSETSKGTCVASR